MKLIVANWKMNPVSVAEAIELAEASDYDNFVICPPYPFLQAVKSVIKKAKLGAQDLFWSGPTGAYTGEVSAAELKKFGVEYVIIGHSERRKLGETNEMVAKKMAAAAKEGLIPILCIGETLEEKKAGLREKVLSEQLKIGFSEIENWKLKIGNLYIAYEPVWAISTNPNAEPDTPEETQKVIKFISNLPNIQHLKSNIQFLYGGSVNAENAQSFLELKDISGALVGGASLKKDQIWKINHYQKIY
ncbi:MAG: triose-phosphate isomerase [Patescibacteria group bacterium]